MNIKQFIRKHGWQMECNSKPGRVMCVDVGFIDDEGREDETQMDINAYDEQELSRLFADFCKATEFLAIILQVLKRICKKIALGQICIPVLINKNCAVYDGCTIGTFREKPFYFDTSITCIIV